MIRVILILISNKEKNKEISLKSQQSNPQKNNKKENFIKKK